MQSILFLYSKSFQYKRLLLEEPYLYNSINRLHSGKILEIILLHRYYRMQSFVLYQISIA